MTRKSNDTGRALEYIIAEEFYKFGFIFGVLAKSHQKDFAPYYKGLDPNQKQIFDSAATNIYNWFNNKFPHIPKFLDCLPDNSGTVVDIVIGKNEQIINLSIKHNHLALRHNRPHGLPNRCGVNPLMAKSYLDDLYKIELAMRAKDKATYFRDMKQKSKWMDDINDNAKVHMEKWAIAYPNSINTYFSYLTSNDRPYYKVEVSNSFANYVYIHEFLGNLAPTNVSISFDNLKYLILEYDNGWKIYKRIHNASSKIDLLSPKVRKSTGDWKWDVQLITQPNKKGYAL